ncbi:metal ABC transporter permease [Larsenimonas salina]|uniref:metal ABC transporter permease n=1 Tax=Larsenimonas salina TaxID=1295565 RepID=UPI0020741E84|nr:metal ABC transporter permease [Larsenimonas salina]MCM5704855.1 metal ABC transporter permease [Larsenimonas salina]
MTLMALLGDYTLQNVALGALFLGLISGVLGSFAVLRKQSLLGDTLSHAALPGICLGFIVTGARHMGSLLLGALFTGTLAALLVMALTRYSRLKTDAALGIVLSTFFALGVVLLSYIQGTGNAAQGGLDAFLFGQAAATLRSDLWVMAAITAIALTLVGLCWKEFKLVCFDPGFASTQGLPVLLLETVLTVMIALAVVVGLQMVGVVLMAAMIIAPAVAARQWSRRLEVMVPLAAVFGMVAGLSGALASTLGRGLATGPLIIIVVSLLVLASLLFAPGRGLVWSWLLRLRQRRELHHQHVLTTLHRLASRHDDHAFYAEQGLLEGVHGTAVRPALKVLAQRGMVTLSTQASRQPRYWQLTLEGQQEAERILTALERGGANS